MITFLRKKRSVVYSWVISFILLLIIPLIANAIVYVVAKNIIETEINTSNELIIDRIRNDIDLVLENVEKFSMEASINARINEVGAMTAIDDGVQAYKVYEAVKDLRNYKMFNHSVRLFYVYFNNLKVVVSPDAIADREDFYNLNLVSEDYPLAKWLETMEAGSREKYYIMSLRDESSASKSRKAIGFMRSFPITRHVECVILMCASS